MTDKRKKKKQFTVEELYNPQIDTSKDAFIYGRQSGKDQVVENIQSHISQTVRLLSYTKVTLGFRDDGTTGRVTLCVENEVMDSEGNIQIKDASGTWSIDKRSRLKAICDAIEHGTPDGHEVGVVIAEYVDRLFRDEDRIDSNIFIKICRENNCYVHIESKRMTYNFANPQHAEMFRLEVQMAAAYIENHVRGTMLRRRTLAAQMGKWAGLGSVPIGYVVDKNKESKTYGKFIVYEPHAQLIRVLFIKFVEYGYDFSALSRELKQTPFLFPPFEPGVFTRCCLTQLPDGSLTIRSEETLRNILTNVTYIGTHKVEGDHIKENHDAILDEELFWSVYDHIRLQRPDGTPTGKLRYIRYTQEKTTPTRPALVYDLLDAPSSYRNSSLVERYYYELRCYGWEQETLICVEADTFENIIVGRLFERLRESNLIDLATSRKQQNKARMQRLKDIARRIATIDEENETLMTNLGQLTIQAVVAQTEQRIQKLLLQRAELEREQVTIEQAWQQADLGSLEEELDGLEESWQKRSFHLRLSLIKILIKKISWNYESPRFYSIGIEWAYKEWGTEYTLVDRKSVGSKAWTDADRAVLYELYPHAEAMDILKRIPNKTWSGVLVEASKLNIKRYGKNRERPDIRLSYHDMLFLQQHNLALTDFQQDMFSHVDRTGWSLQVYVHVS